MILKEPVFFKLLIKPFILYTVQVVKSVCFFLPFFDFTVAPKSHGIVAQEISVNTRRGLMLLSKVRFVETYKCHLGNRNSRQNSLAN